MISKIKIPGGMGHRKVDHLGIKMTYRQHKNEMVCHQHLIQIRACYNPFGPATTTILNPATQVLESKRYNNMDKTGESLVDDPSEL